MSLAVLAAVGSILAGTALGALAPRRGRLLDAVRTFAVVSAVAVVLGRLLPDALGHVGGWAVLAVIAGFVTPSLIEWAAGEDPEHDGRFTWGLELTFWGLALHKLGDGLALGLYTSSGHAGHAHGDIVAAIAAHSVPVTALMVMALTAARGVRSALWRAGLLVIAAVAGVVWAHTASTPVLTAAEPWISAVVSGLLLHVVTHDWAHEHDRPTEGGWSEALAVGLGLGVLALGSGHHHGDAGLTAAIADSLLELSLVTAPALLIGLAIGALLQLYGDKIPLQWLRSGSPFRQAVRGAVVGAPIPLCACGVLPVAQSLKTRGASGALVVSFLLATPELGIETLALTARFFGWSFAFVRVSAAVLVAIAAGWMMAWLSGRGGQGDADDTPVVVGHGGGRTIGQFLHHFGDLLRHVGPWTLVGLLVAAYADVVLASKVVSLGAVDVLIVSLVAIPSYVCAAAATPLAAVLLVKGLSPGAVLAGLLLGPATNLATVGFLRSNFSARAVALSIGALVLATWAIAYGLNFSGMEVQAIATGTGEAHAHGWIAWASLALLCLAIVHGIWSRGFRRWFATLGEGLGRPQHAHSH